MSNIPAIVTLGAAVILPAALKRQFYDEAESQVGWANVFWFAHQLQPLRLQFRVGKR